MDSNKYTEILDEQYEKVIKEIRERQQFTKKSRKKKLIKDKAIHKQKYLKNIDNE